ncbi:MAG: hypothetical protein ACRD4B_07675 [Acidobacteriota bacterium]
MSLFAYLDPGTGSYLIQIIIGGVLGVGVIVKAYWSKIKSIFVKGKNTKKEAKSDEA